MRFASARVFVSALVLSSNVLVACDPQVAPIEPDLTASFESAPRAGERRCRSACGAAQGDGAFPQH
jgi:hypothetical protein